MKICFSFQEVASIFLFKKLFTLFQSHFTLNREIQNSNADKDKMYCYYFYTAILVITQMQTGLNWNSWSPSTFVWSIKGYQQDLLSVWNVSQSPLHLLQFILWTYHECIKSTSPVGLMWWQKYNFLISKTITKKKIWWIQDSRIFWHFC